MKSVSVFTSHGAKLRPSDISTLSLLSPSPLPSTCGIRRRGLPAHMHPHLPVDLTHLVKPHFFNFLDESLPGKAQHNWPPIPGFARAEDGGLSDTLVLDRSQATVMPADEGKAPVCTRHEHLEEKGCCLLYAVYCAAPGSPFAPVYATDLVPDIRLYNFII